MPCPFLWNHGKRKGYKTLANCAVNSIENFQKHNQPPSMHSLFTKGFRGTLDVVSCDWSNHGNLKEGKIPACANHNTPKVIFTSIRTRFRHDKNVSFTPMTLGLGEVLRWGVLITSHSCIIHIVQLIRIHHLVE